MSLAEPRKQVNTPAGLVPGHGDFAEDDSTGLFSAHLCSRFWWKFEYSCRNTSNECFSSDIGIFFPCSNEWSCWAHFLFSGMGSPSGEVRFWDEGCGVLVLSPDLQWSGMGSVCLWASGFPFSKLVRRLTPYCWRVLCVMHWFQDLPHSRSLQKTTVFL